MHLGAVYNLRDMQRPWRVRDFPGAPDNRMRVPPEVMRRWGLSGMGCCNCGGTCTACTSGATMAGLRGFSKGLGADVCGAGPLPAVPAGATEPPSNWLTWVLIALGAVMVARGDDEEKRQRR